MTTLSDLGACYRWVKAFVPTHKDRDEFGLALFRSCEFEQPIGGANVALSDERETEHLFMAADLPTALKKAATWARRQLAREAARKKREAERLKARKKRRAK